MEEQKTFTNNKGDKLSGILLSKSKDKSGLIVIICHGFTSSKSTTSKVIAEELAEVGINSFRFDFYAHGESEGKFENISISEGVEDILKAIDFLLEAGYKNIGLLGTSYGGACCILAASQAKSISCLALRSPVPDYYTRELMTRTKDLLEDWKAKGYRIYTKSDGKELKLSYNFFKDMKKYNGFLAAEGIKVPTFIVHGDADESVPIILSEMLSKVIQNCELTAIRNADHQYTDERLKKKAIEEIVSFFAKQ